MKKKIGVSMFGESICVIHNLQKSEEINHILCLIITMHYCNYYKCYLIISNLLQTLGWRLSYELHSCRIDNKLTSPTSYAGIIKYYVLPQLLPYSDWLSSVCNPNRVARPISLCPTNRSLCTQITEISSLFLTT